MADCRLRASDPSGLCGQPADHAALNAPMRLQGAAIPTRQGENRRVERRFDQRARVSFRVFWLFLTGKTLT
ncbi:MAG: hypothetical protein DLM68_04525, partial [Hyphomicrobiales bacterium]